MKKIHVNMKKIRGAYIIARKTGISRKICLSAACNKKFFHYNPNPVMKSEDFNYV